MNGEFQIQNLIKSMKMNSVNNRTNDENNLQLISTPDLQKLKNSLKDNIDDYNGSDNKFLNITQTELFNYELDQSTESIMNSQNLLQQMDGILDKNIIRNNDIINKSLNKGEEFKIENNKCDIAKYEDEIRNLKEKLNFENLKNLELKNNIELLKQTINTFALKGNKEMDKNKNYFNKENVDLLTDNLKYKAENQKIKKQIVMQQILYNDMKNEIINLKKENNLLKISSEKLLNENKSLQKVKEDITKNYNSLREESNEIKNALLKYEEEFTTCQKNNSSFIALKASNSELIQNYEKQKVALLSLQEDFNKLNKTNSELCKFNEKLTKENQQLKREIFHKDNILQNLNNKMNSNVDNIKEKNELINSIKDIQNKNLELIEDKNNQKIEIDSLNKIINDKNNEIVKYLNEIQELKENSNKYSGSGDINLDVIIHNVKNELEEKNKLIEDLKSKNIKLINENKSKDNEIKDNIIDKGKKEKENFENIKKLEQIDKLNNIIQEKDIEIYNLKNNEKSYNKIIDLSFQSIKQFINKLKNFEEFKENYINLNISNLESDLFIRPLKEFVDKINEENKNNTNYYNGSNIPMIEKIKKINIFTNIIPFEINVLYNKVKTLQQENKVLLNIKKKSSNINNLITEEENSNNILLRDDDIKDKSMNTTDINFININKNTNYKSVTDTRQNFSRTNSNSQNKNDKGCVKKFFNNQKVKEINSLLYEDSNFNKDKKSNINDTPFLLKNGKKSRITLFKEEIINKNMLNNYDKIDSNNNISTYERNISKEKLSINNNKSNNTTTYLDNINNINLSQPMTNRTNQRSKNHKKNIFNNNHNINIFDEINISYTSKNVLHNHTVDSNRYNLPSINDNSLYLNNKKKRNNRRLKGELYQKGINGLAEEVMKPSFLKSDVSMTMLGSGLNSSTNNNESFLFLAKNRMRRKNRDNENYSFIEIQNTNKRNFSPFNRSNSKNGSNNNLHRNRSFLF